MFRIVIKKNLEISEESFSFQNKINKAQYKQKKRTENNKILFLIVGIIF